MKTTAINSERIGHKLNRGNGYWVSKNEDGTLTISQNGIETFANAGSLINTLGGIDATLAACEAEEITAGAYNEELREQYHVFRYGKRPTEEQKAERMAFYNELKGKYDHRQSLPWAEMQKTRLIATPHHPVNGNEGMRFEYPFTDFRFDSINGWQKHSPVNGWVHISETSRDIVALRIHFNLPKYQPTAEEEAAYNETYNRVIAENERTAQREQEINEAWEAIKDMKPIPSTIENIYTMLRYFRLHGVGELPMMTIGYSCNEYDCGGKRPAVAVKLDEAIIVNEDGEMSDRIVYGASPRHLGKYYHI